MGGGGGGAMKTYSVLKIVMLQCFDIPGVKIIFNILKDNFLY